MPEDKQPVSPAELDAILKQQEAWRDDGQGHAANLRGKNLSDPALAALFTEKDLTGADLAKADLSHQQMKGTILTKANLWGANLHDADLTGATGLLPTQFAAANLAGAKGLSEEFYRFVDSTQLDKVSKSARTMFVIMLLACAYCYLMIELSTDERLLFGTPLFQLPTTTQGAPMYFDLFQLGPILLLGCYLYFHVYVFRLRERLSLLPCVFPDGVPLYQKVYPWLLSETACRRFTDPEHRPHLYWTQKTICLLLCDLTPTSVLFLFWLTYLRCHKPVPSFFHAFCLAAAIFLWILFFRMERDLSKGELRKMQRWLPPRHRAIEISSLILSASFLSLITFGAVFGTESPDYPEKISIANPRVWVPIAFQHLPSKFAWRANLEEEDLSAKSSAGENDADVTHQRRLVLNGRNLTGALMGKAVLANADLRNTNLSNADLSGAILRGVRFNSRTNLTNTNIGSATFADLKLSDLPAPELRDKIRGARNWLFARYDPQLEEGLGVKGLGAAVARKNLSGFDLSKSNLRFADLRELDLSGANLYRADLRGAQLRGSDLNGTYFQDATNVDAKEVKRARNWLRAFYPDDVLKQLDLRKDHNERVRNRNFSRYALRGLSLREADFRDTSLADAVLLGTDLSGSKLAGADLTCALLDNLTDLRDTDVTATQLLMAEWKSSPRVSDAIDAKIPSSNDCKQR
jgi:uncharacterized protein YjbI with pentapeptide repeats